MELAIDFVDSDWKEIQESNNTETVKKQPKFQSPEEFMQDYEAYKKGKRYKLIFSDTELVYTEYVSENLFKIRHNSIKTFYYDNTISVIDLKHKFDVVCKVE